MSGKYQNGFLGVSREAEESRLQETLDIVRDNLAGYKADVAALRASIDDMQAHFHDDNPELINELENTYTMYDFLSNTLARNERALKKPYFGRIDVVDEKAGGKETFYIGRSGIFKDVIHPVVIDWRAPVANVYYENGLGKCSYISPEGEGMGIDLKLKRTYEIENGCLQNIFDTETIANDDILTKYLSKNKQAVLGEIVATIQKEQNEIIRRSPLYNCLVQGVAGSGKTTVAMHRISYILYNYADRFKPEDFYIVGSNQLLLNYITGVLPDLDVYGVRQMTMEQLFVRLLYEDWDKLKYRIKATDTKNPRNMVKGSLGWFRDLDNYCRKLEQTSISRESVYLNPGQFVEGFVDGKAGVHDRTGGKIDASQEMVLLMDGTGLDDFLAQYPTLSIQSKINMLNERLTERIKDEFVGKGVKYTTAERNAILRAYRGKYGPTRWKRSIYTLYRAFLMEQAQRGMAVDIPDKAFDVYDLAALAYLYKRVKETEEISEAHHIVIDEAQDFGMMVYSVLHACIKDCTYTIMGDVSQNIHFGYGLNDWEELRQLYINDVHAGFGILKKSYRNTVEISKFATRILHHGQFAVYPVEPIIRHGNEPVVEQVREIAVETVDHGTKSSALIKRTAEVCRQWQQQGLETIAVICRDQEKADKAAEELGRLIPVKQNDPETAEFGSGIMVLPVELTKGLEFDAVLILDPTPTDYPMDDGHAKLLYVAATRALHELCVLHTGELTGLISEPVEENRLQLMAEEKVRENVNGKPAVGREGKVPSKIKAETKTVYGFRRKDRIGEDDCDKLDILKKKQPVSRSVGNVVSAVPKKQAVDGEKPEKIFGSLPDTSMLRAIGHSRIDQSVRWVTKEADGLYLKSTYGILRISPIEANMIRVTFSSDNALPRTAHRNVALTGTADKWKYRESPKLLELRTEKIFIRVDKTAGNIFFMTADGTPLLAERDKESRLTEKMTGGKPRMRQYFSWPKNEELYGLSKGAKADLFLTGTAKYISYGEALQDAKLPAVISTKGYGLVIASDNPVCCCDISGYGGHLLVENTDVLDYYFVTGGSAQEVIGECNRLRCKK